MLEDLQGSQGIAHCSMGLLIGDAEMLANCSEFFIGKF
jgi:hypothetical protein